MTYCRLVDSHTKSPHIRFEGVIRRVTEYLWSCIVRASTLRGDKLIGGQIRRQPEISDLRMTVSIEEDVVRLDIAMRNVVFVTCNKAIEYIGKQNADNICAHWARFFDLVSQISALAQFEHEEKEVVNTEIIVYPDHIWVIERREGDKFGIFGLSFAVEEGLVDLRHFCAKVAPILERSHKEGGGIRS